MGGVGGGSATWGVNGRIIPTTTPKKHRVVIQSLVNPRPKVPWHIRERHDTHIPWFELAEEVLCAPLCSDEGGPVGPVLRGVGGGVDREDEVYFARGLEERPKGDVLVVEAAVGEGEGGLVLDEIGRAGAGGVAVEGVGVLWER